MRTKLRAKLQRLIDDIVIYNYLKKKHPYNNNALTVVKHRPPRRIIIVIVLIVVIYDAMTTVIFRGVYVFSGAHCLQIHRFKKKI